MHADIVSGEICQDYIAGRCHDGIDCKFSHPAIADEQEPIAISELPPSPFYAAHFPPSPPVQFLPVPIFVQPPPLHYPRRGLHRSQHRKARRPHTDEMPLLNGNTLTPMQQLQDGSAVDISSREEATPTPVSTSPPQTSSQLFAERSIERPVSTPPSTRTSFSKIIRVRSLRFLITHGFLIARTVS